MGGAAGWEPATDAEVALYDALAGGDQEGYFQALGRINLLLPVSADAAAGRTPMGWGTWTANNHTHLLAFTSDQSMRTCLAQHVGGARRMLLRDLAAIWPNDEWWLAVNPGLPIEGYLPAWFVAQLARGDARLPGKRSSTPRDRLERVQALERAKAAKAAALPREPIRTVATAGGPLALPPATASPRWARDPLSIVDAEEVTPVLPRRTPARTYESGTYQAPAVPPAGRTQPPLEVPEAYQSPTVPPPASPLPSRAAPATAAGRFGVTPAVAPNAPEEPGVSRWAGLAEARWTGPAEEPPVPEQRRSLFEEARPVPAAEGRSLFAERHSGSPEEPGSVRSEERLGLRDRRQALLGNERTAARDERAGLGDQSSGRREDRHEDGYEQRREDRRGEWPAAQAESPAAPDEQATTFFGRQPVIRDERSAAREERSTALFEQWPTARKERPMAREERSAIREERPAGREEAPAGREEKIALRQEKPASSGEGTAAAREEKHSGRAEGPRHAEPEPEFVPANAVEEQLYEAAEAGNTDAFLSTLLLATVLIPKASGTTNGKWRPQPIDGEPHIVSYTSTQHLAEPLETIPIKFIKLISEWPDPNWSFAINPGTPVGATLPGGQLLALANWAAEVGLGGDDEEDIDEPSVKLNGTPVAGRVSPEVPVLQKAIAPSQVGYYLERGYDRVTGFVHRAHEVGHLKSASQMRAALGLDYQGSPFSVEADEIYLLRWSAHRPSLYRIPYGGQNESGMHAMQGWVIERAPFRGNGFAPGETGEVIAEFKVDSARLPHGARLMRLKDGVEEMIAIFDADTQKWLRTDGGS